MKIDLSEFEKFSDQEKIERLWCELDGMEKDRNYWFGQAHCNYEDMRKGHGIQAVQDAFNLLKPIIEKKFAWNDAEKAKVGELFATMDGYVEKLKKEMYNT